MTKVELAQLVAASHGISATAAKDIINTILMSQTRTLLSSGEVSLDGLCKIKIGQNKSRNARNPRTGESVFVPAKKTLRIKPSLTILRDLNT